MGLPNQYADADGNRKPDAPAGTNQFIKGTRNKHDQRTKDAIRAELLSQRLHAFVTGRPEDDDDDKTVPDLSPAQVAAAKILIDKGKPNLQAVEQTTVDPMDSMTPEQLKDTVRALITAHPELIREFAPGPEPVQSDSASKAA